MRYVASAGVAVAAILMVRKLVEKGHADRILRFSFWLSLASVSTIFVSYLFPSINQTITVSHRAGRYSGFFGNPNEVSTQALIATALGFCMAARTTKLKYLQITIALCVPAVLLSHSRAGVIGIAFLIMSLSLIVFPAKHVVRSAFALFFVGVVAFGGLQYLQSVSESSGNVVLELSLIHI